MQASSGSFHKPLILLHQKADRLKTTITENEPIWLDGPQLCLTQWNWVMPWTATQDGWVMVESYNKTWSTGEGTGKPLQYSCLENPMNSMKRPKDITLNDETSPRPRSVSVQYATGEKWRNSYRWNEEAEVKWKRCPVVAVSGDESEVQ